MNETLKDKLRRIMNLAERGSAGERQAAASLLDKLLKKHNLTVDDLTSDVKTLHWIETGRNNYNKALLIQIRGALTGSYNVEHMPGRTMLGFKCTDMEAAELKRQFDFYRAAMDREFRRQKDIIFEAFVRTNGIYPDPQTAGPGRPLTRKELARIREVLDMSGRMERTPYHKALEQHHG